MSIGVHMRKIDLICMNATGYLVFLKSESWQYPRLFLGLECGNKESNSSSFWHQRVKYGDTIFHTVEIR